MSDDEITIRRIPPMELPPLTPEDEARWLAEHGHITTLTVGGRRVRVPEPDER